MPKLNFISDVTDGRLLVGRKGGTGSDIESGKVPISDRVQME